MTSRDFFFSFFFSSALRDGRWQMADGRWQIAENLGRSANLLASSLVTSLKSLTREVEGDPISDLITSPDHVSAIPTGQAMEVGLVRDCNMNTKEILQGNGLWCVIGSAGEYPLTIIPENEIESSLPSPVPSYDLS